jgi:hypothetical protein
MVRAAKHPSSRKTPAIGRLLEVGVLRLRGKCASRNFHYAQDDTETFSFVLFPIRCRGICPADNKFLHSIRFCHLERSGWFAIAKQPRSRETPAIGSLLEVGVLRLRGKCASRNFHHAQDDMETFSFVLFPIRCRGICTADNKFPTPKVLSS